LMEYFTANPARVVGQRELIDNVFGGAHTADTSLVRVHVHKLRRALGPSRDAIRTVPGLGYYFEPALQNASVAPHRRGF
jgi:DNA-binding response OmpR family regulator